MALLLFDVFLPDVDDEVRHAMEKSIDQPIHFAFRQSSDGSLHLQRREKLDDKAHSHYQGTLMVDQTSPPYVKDGLFAHNYINGVREERDDIHGDSPLQKGPPPRLPASMQKAAEWHAKTLAAERGESGPGQKEDIRYITTWKDEAR
ncbi:hypothetical protein SBRCBS47491_007369 [Sporothrix bragantina]|uniref:Uncharacterized protein n=1 Tax=Sporothrix bragantina TaxID=671064 RepID=A0ABP0CCM4_9PEZI